MSFEKIMTDLKQKKFAPIYLLMGEEPYFIDKISEYLVANLLKEEEKAFNQTILYGKEADAGAITDAARRFPMMSQYQLVLVREAQNIKDIENLVYYASNPLKSTVLVLSHKYKNLDKRKKLYKEIEKHGLVLESKKLYDNKIPDWIAQHLKTRGFEIQPTAAVLLTEYLGNDLLKMEKELEKLTLTLPEGSRLIDTRHIEENIGISKEFNTIELQRALVEKDSLKSFRIVDYFGKNQKNNPLTVTLTSLYFFFNRVFLYAMLKDKSKEAAAAQLKIHPFFIGEYKKAAQVYPPRKTYQIIRWLREYDLRSKGVNNASAGPEELLKELVYKIISI
ncbi:MAG: DNA polymerase III subunit delta [Bacteroidales bacterium]|nr:DNA polymerase III subunit delta [Bacteroidales bacterium]